MGFPLLTVISILYVTTAPLLRTLQRVPPMGIRSRLLALELVRKLVLAWDPDYTRATPSEDAAMGQAVRELKTGVYLTDKDINWD